MPHYQAFQGVAQETESLVVVVTFQYGAVKRVMTEDGKWLSSSRHSCTNSQTTNLDFHGSLKGAQKWLTMNSKAQKT